MNPNEKENWPSKSSYFLTAKPAFTQLAFENRTNENLYYIFSKTFNETKLWSSIDNWGIFRGTKDLVFKTDDGTEVIKDRIDWRFFLKPHWDINPWVYLNSIHKLEEHRQYQALVALVDCPEEVGCLCTVPGSTVFLQTWTKEHLPPFMKRHSVRIDEADPMAKYMQNVRDS